MWSAPTHQTECLPSTPRIYGAEWSTETSHHNYTPRVWKGVNHQNCNHNLPLQLFIVDPCNPKFPPIFVLCLFDHTVYLECNLGKIFVKQLIWDLSNSKSSLKIAFLESCSLICFLWIRINTSSSPFLILSTVLWTFWSLRSMYFNAEQDMWIWIWDSIRDPSSGLGRCVCHSKRVTCHTQFSSGN